MGVQQVGAVIYRRLCDFVLGPLFGTHCPICGYRTILRRRDQLDERLVCDWRLSSTWVAAFNQREFTFCHRCGAKGRDRQFGQVLTQIINSRCNSAVTDLSAAITQELFQQCKIAEINSIGMLHAVIARHSNLIYSEFGSNKPNVPHQDLLALTYLENSFDYVLTSETLEHIPDFEKGLSEIFRVLKPGGSHVFTIPVVWDRPQTLQRAALRNGQIQHLDKPSYHGGYTQSASDYLVFYEFGADVRQRVESVGYQLRIVFDDQNPALAVFIASKPQA